MPDKSPDKASLREGFLLNYRAFQLMNKACPQMFLSVFCAAVSRAVTPYVGIYFSARILTELAGERRPEVLWQWVGITVAVTALLMLLNAVLSRWTNCRRDAGWCNFNKIYANKMLDMDFCSASDQHTHDLRSQIHQNTQWSGWGFSHVLWDFDTAVKAIFSVISAVTLTVSLFTSPVAADSPWAALNHPLTGIAMVALMLVFTLLAPLCSNKANNYWARCADDAKLGNRFFGFFGFMAYDRARALDIRMYNQQIACEYYMNKEKVFVPGSRLANYALGPMGALSGAAASLATVFTGLVYAFVCLKAWAGAFGIGAVAQYAGAITAMSQGVSSLISAVGQMKNNAVFLRTTFEFLDIPHPMYQGSLTTEKRTDRQYEVEFKNVSFKYPAADTYALKDVSLKFRVGQRLAVVGMNGSGKTTFIKLLCRLYDPTAGEILLNGINIRKYRYDDYLAIFSVVFQDFQLLAYPLGENVAIGQAYDHALAMECLYKAGFSDRLAKMPKALDTCLYKEFNDNGVEISGGEGQKIAIARALYKDAPFMILDEPTAALDPIAEAEIYTKFNEIVGDKTAIYISHRLSSCRFCDDIAVFHEGRLTQQGSHEALVADTAGKYYELWNAQAQYYHEGVRGRVAPA